MVNHIIPEPQSYSTHDLYKTTWYEETRTIRITWGFAQMHEYSGSKSVDHHVTTTILSVDEEVGVNAKMRFWPQRLCTNKRHMQPQVALQVL